MTDLKGVKMGSSAQRHANCVSVGALGSPLSFLAGVGQNTALQAPLTARNSAAPIPAFPVHFAGFLLNLLN